MTFSESVLKEATQKWESTRSIIRILESYCGAFVHSVKCSRPRGWTEAGKAVQLGLSLATDGRDIKGS